VKGRKRHLLVDTLGLVLKAVVTPANVQDRDGARLILQEARAGLERMRHLWMDAAQLSSYGRISTNESSFRRPGRVWHD
jgi:transposase